MIHRHPTASLWLFAYAGLPGQTHMAITRELMGWPNLSHYTAPRIANIDRARSLVASRFVREPSGDAGDVMLLIDADNPFAHGDLSHIARRALERNAVVGGIYSKRIFDQGPTFRPTDGAAGTYTLGEDDLIPCEFAATGFIAIPRLILEALRETLPTVKGDMEPYFMPYVVMNGYGENEYPTDDQAFCARVREAGFPVYVSTLPRIGHIGDYEFRMEDSSVNPPPDRKVTITIPERATVPA